MTELNTAYRTDQDTVEDDDPLAELARIVSGEATPNAEISENASQEDELQDFDIEAQLMRELGEAEPSPVAENIVPLTVETTEPSMPEQEPNQETISTAPPLEDELSLEDQLMAELGSVDIATVEPVVELPHSPPSSIEETEPFVGENSVERIEAIAANLQSDINLGSENPQFDQLEATAEQSVGSDDTALAVENSTADDQLETFFTDNFADLLESEQAAQLDKAPEAIPASSGVDDFDFGEAFNAELNAGEPTIEVSKDPVEDDFAKAFENELMLDTTELPVVASAVVHEPSPVSAPDPLLDAQLNSGGLGDFDADTYAKPTPAPTSSKSGFKLAVGALCLALAVGVGVVGWGSFYGEGASISDEPVVIKADTAPSKVKPEEPGGKQIANQDNQVYTKVAGTETTEPAQEQLISSRETVAIEPKANPAEPKANDRLSPKAEPAKEQATLGISPKKVKTFTVKPDGTIIQSAPARAATSVANTLKAPATASVEPAPASNLVPTNVAAAQPVEDASIVSIDGAISTGAIGIPVPSPLPAAKAIQTAAVKPAVAPAPKPVSPAPKPANQASTTDADSPTQIANLSQAPKPTVTSSEWKVQVSSQRSRDAAEASFKNIQRRFGSVLSGKTANIQRADVESKGTFYRVKVLASSKSEATKLCSRLKSAGGSCFVTR